MDHPLTFFAKTFPAAFHRLVPEHPASEIETCLGVTIANMIGPIGDETWAEMVAASRVPCGEADCGCEGLRAQVFEILSKVRDDWREQRRTFIPGGQG